ncbi:cysteine--1-D-myo-inosityl 2-amino-2-deoxy-alpha-D-glucopyranoside ligase [Corynebacterium mendelii]|uniref:L-cysteine:1D-myo-inositol 2-amino-2-deoxy-alpha-D-glucopyranoside ligase n=1 Tax=Corynebacterium mendelii TaxID=2765362 RepID=A0A939DYC6_9CORY|nr:cysteine--1-D-myo-inosityl 2-amino-2-deoxy-alpha-D-glucopyranoside ligase [Corynebacterium mendelii]MBN9643495.1 cysteine--1-D-myo-inosityl 2-amino-2-deoxy-alpha-D-glucopyranoside ligase [Corynebacterium mendelii]
MHTWTHPVVDVVGGTPVPPTLYDHARDGIFPVELPATTDTPVGLYVCGITPYDATHLGHAATYLAFDVLHRLILDNGYRVHFVENITDIDDPLFERADRDRVDWRSLGSQQIDLFRSDMAALSVIPPDDFVAVTDVIDEIIELVGTLIDRGVTYRLTDPDTGATDIYCTVEATEHFGYESRYDNHTMLELSAERGGDPQRPGKRHPLDAMVWKGHREGEPFWQAPFGAGRPGWHIECAAIAAGRLGAHFAVQAGGRDLIFPHHEYTAAHVEAATGITPMAGHYAHTGMIGLDGTKMSKSLGNLVFVHKLTDAGHDPSAIRLAIFDGHYRSDRDFSDGLVARAGQRLELWRAAARSAGDAAAADTLVAELRNRLADDLDTPGALAAVDAWATASTSRPTGTDSQAGNTVSRALGSLLGVYL